MKLVLNIQKKHLFFLIALSIIISIGIVFGTPYPTSKPPSHDQLWTKEIFGKDVITINVKDNLDLNDKSINAFRVASQDVFVFGTLSAHSVYLWDDDADGFIDKDYGGNDCDDTNIYIYPDTKDKKNPNVAIECSSRDYNCDGIIVGGCSTGPSAPKEGRGGSPLIMKEIFVGTGPSTTANRWWEGIGYRECPCPSGTPMGIGTLCIYPTRSAPC